LKIYYDINPVSKEFLEMTNNSGTAGTPDSKEVLISERGSETFMVFDSGLDDDVIEGARTHLVEELGFDIDDDAINHGEVDGERLATMLSIAHNHFGTFRHDRAEQVLNAITLALAESRISVDVIEAPKDFNQN
jgi:hypothetical protein